MVSSVVDVHLAYMPFSHSMVSAVLIGLIAGVGLWRWSGSSAIGWAVGLGVIFHILLDLVTHPPTSRSLRA